MFSHRRSQPRLQQTGGSKATQCGTSPSIDRNTGTTSPGSLSKHGFKWRLRLGIDGHDSERVLGLLKLLQPASRHRHHRRAEMLRGPPNCWKTAESQTVPQISLQRLAASERTAAAAHRQGAQGSNPVQWAAAAKTTRARSAVLHTGHSLAHQRGWPDAAQLQAPRSRTPRTCGITTFRFGHVGALQACVCEPMQPPRSGPARRLRTHRPLSRPLSPNRSRRRAASGKKQHENAPRRYT